jgi:hypothetical protein
VSDPRRQVVAAEFPQPFGYARFQHDLVSFLRFAPDYGPTSFRFHVAAIAPASRRSTSARGTGARTTSCPAAFKLAARFSALSNWRYSVSGSETLRPFTRTA